MPESITKDIFENINAASLSEVFEQEAQNIEIIQEDLIEYIKALQESASADEFTELSAKQLEDAIYRRAFMDCVEIIQDKALNFLVTEAVRAIVITQEFNYDLYVNHLLSAMEANQKKLIAIHPRVGEKAIIVKVSFNILGKPEQWGKAIKAYRQQKGLGKSRGQIGEYGELSSHFWREKYYGSAREGTQVKKIYKTSRPSRDVTKKYKGKYRETIAGRLAILPSNKAPFWYLIEHGNADVSLGIDPEGVPYPTFGPTNFVRNTEEVVLAAFLQIWTRYESEAREILESLEDERVRELRERTREEIEKGEVKVAEGKLINTVKIDEGKLESYLQSETIRVSLRDPKTGRYADVPMGR
jgi:hypothetical protein